MKKLDIRHIVFHTLIAVYSIWLVVYGTLLTVALINVFGAADRQLSKVFMIWIFLNLLMGSILFVVIRLYRTSGRLNRLVFYSYIFMAIASVVSVLLIYTTS
jgi:hypothetical protein